MGDTCAEHREVKDILGKIFNKLESMAVTQAETSVRMEVLSSGVRRLQDTLTGNGHPGIVEEVHHQARVLAEHEQSIINLNTFKNTTGNDAGRFLSDLNEAKRGVLQKVGPWILAALGAILGAEVALRLGIHK